MTITRREFFKSGIATLLLVPASYAVSVSIGGYPNRGGLNFLTNKEARIIDSVAEVIIPSENELGVSIYDVDVAKGVEEFALAAPEPAQRRIRLLLWSIEHIFPLRGFYFCKFSRLSLQSRKKILSRFDSSQDSGSRALLRAMKAMIQTTYYNHPKVMSAIGFEPKCTV